MDAGNLQSLALPEEKKSWFVHDRFGMFVHWGLYALPARHEWVKSREELDDADYQKYFDHFDPDLYDPREWARRAKAAGMKYVVLTTKHHEGFCLWDTKATGFKVTNTPYRKDLLRPFVDAFRAEGLRIGFYYSLIDWHHPDFTVDPRHPQRNHPDASKINEGRDMQRYAAFMREQVRELLTEFGQIDIMWFDFSYPQWKLGELVGKGHQDWESEKLVRLVRELAPDIIINNRLDLAGLQPDIVTPEQYMPRAWPKRDGRRVVWEACQTLSGSWGYHRDEDTWKSTEQLVQMLVGTVAIGGNLLMNVGPTARGTLDHRAISALSAYEDWMALHERSIVGCTQSDFTAPPDCRLTQNGDRLYIHLFNWPYKHLHFDALAGKIEYAQFLHDASEVTWLRPSANTLWANTQFPVGEDELTFVLPVRRPKVVVPVIEVKLKAGSASGIQD
ncbi:alpha-L-fucosidase (plasmid) [Rhizobium leguminosarum bv. trifolii CB782]|uniref:alpha-L-fucosidase n=1 Tax=Rhizobium hidalgonense TaxID=1538159 RepID=A0AAJ2LK28_9HYPH|nr:alpha-L-fucosidase [Rhizobium hidalgonense]AHG48287.1 alpha-L-fucosidase [Rhizobium leguminosarum bv. trifolii CB782]EJC72216.1 alpha-L-fucosidase [Rhizobium leguminosarum bv. trifolii WSM2012]MDR9772128.1 alpha-L-fucosidase [Rhizobium hidalgonense]MDR9810186.1 alpha-L-fucosidase [Rhizobium hidalgonense]MDR9817805.1 alpha-L-fucosidase [Rhizobium hidalgonense]